MTHELDHQVSVSYLALIPSAGDRGIPAGRFRQPSQVGDQVMEGCLGRNEGPAGSLPRPCHLHGLEGIDQAVAGLEIEPFIGHVGGGADDDLAGFPGFQFGIGGEHEGDGAAEHGTGEGVAAAGGGGSSPEGGGGAPGN